MCDRKILLSDRNDWDELAAESTSAERYSRRLSDRIGDGYGAKFEPHADPGGLAPLGFRRSPERGFVLEVDLAAIATAAAISERYALAPSALTGLAEETGLSASRLRCLLKTRSITAW